VLAELAREHRLTEAAAAILTAMLDESTIDFGRVVRDAAGRVDRIVERTDATDDELAIPEVNTSIYCFRRGLLAPALRRLSPDNAQGEYYLTDVVSVLGQAGHLVLAVPAQDQTAALHVNDRAQLAAAERVVRARINDRWMREGVTMVDPACTYIDTSVQLAPDVHLLPNTILEGHTVIASGAAIGPDSQLVDTVVGRGAVVRQTVAREAEIGDGATIGPFVSLRAGTRIAAGAHVGTFVEMKNAEIGEGAKVPHLSYIGDAEVGAGANIGAGNITANYDGTRKHRTRIGKGAKTGSNTVFVAPVEVGDDARTGAGAVVNRDVPPGALAKGVPARIEEGWTAAREDDGEADAEGT
jgi:bifunctional UDP-N-acetylglucosamine pyrophosphorylase/glucosamine-1-phosphate N-acetyltransferase